MNKKNLIYKILIGIFSGIICGLFASGGGMILVPAFVYILKMDEVKARATSIVCILPMVITSGLFYYNNNYFDYKIGTLVAIGGVLGGIVGAKILNKLPVKYLRVLFIVFLIYSSYKLII